MKIVSNGYSTHLVIEDQTPEAVAYAQAIFDADKLFRKQGVTSIEADHAYIAIDAAGKALCKAHGFKNEAWITSALIVFARQLHTAENIDVLA